MNSSLLSRYVMTAALWSHVELSWHFQTRKVLGCSSHDCNWSLPVLPWALPTTDTQAGTQAALLGLHMLSVLPLSLDSRAFSALPSAREKPGSFHNSNHTADTFSESEVSRLSWQRGLTKMLCALEPLRRKAGCRMYIQGGWSSPQHRNFGGC